MKHQHKTTIKVKITLFIIMNYLRKKTSETRNHNPLKIRKSENQKTNITRPRQKAYHQPPLSRQITVNHQPPAPNSEQERKIMLRFKIVLRNLVNTTGLRLQAVDCGL
jgi:hypothetical protein